MMTSVIHFRKTAHKAMLSISLTASSVLFASLGEAVDNDVSVVEGRWVIDAPTQYDLITTERGLAKEKAGQEAYENSVKALNHSLVIEKKKLKIVVNERDVLTIIGSISLAEKGFIFKGASTNQFEELKEKKTIKGEVFITQQGDGRILAKFSWDDDTVLGQTLSLKRP